MIYLIYLCIGILASFLSGLLGIGGGLIIVPALVLTFTHFKVVDPSQVMHMVIGTSLASSLFNLVSSVRAHHVRQAVHWSVVRSMAPGLLLGALLLGPGLVRVLPGSVLKGIFGAFCLFMGLQLLRQGVREPGVTAEDPEGYGLIAWGLLVGVMSTLLGLAGGVMIALVFNYYRMPMRVIIGTGSACALLIAAAGTVGLLLLNSHTSPLPAYSTGYVYWPALLCIALPAWVFAKFGASCAHKLSVQRLRQLFACLILTVGAQMLWSTIHFSI